MKSIPYKDAYDVAWKIVLDEKRVEKIKNTPHRKMGERIEGLITAVCREGKVKLTEEERRATRLFIHMKMRKKGIVL